MKKKTSAEARKEAAIKQKKKKRKTAILNTLLVIFILIFLGSGTYLGLYFYKIRKAENSFDDVKKLIKEDGSKDPETGKKQDTDFTSYETIEGNLVQSKFADVYTKNPDFIGWLTIPGTNVDYPVMYTPNDEQKYLHMDFNGDYSSSGTLFAAAGSNPLKARDNTLIYGHNMKAGTMFHALLSYESESFYKEHSKITFNTTFEDAEYEVIAAFRTKIDEDDPNSFKYYEFFKAENKEEFDEYVQKVKSLTPYNIEESAVYGENLLTLSTCAYHTNEGRYVVVAKKIKN
ncbi:MAG: class B sortase [Eubacterium sp.]|nr:class B sortase [Eubacterium sp.]